MIARLLPALLCLSVACQQAVDPGETADAGDPLAEDSGRTTSDPDGGPRADGGDGGAGTDGSQAGAVLAAASAQAAGELGQDLWVRVEFTPARSAVTKVGLRALDPQGRPNQVFDSDWDGLPDSAETSTWLEDQGADGALRRGAAVWPGLVHPDLEVSQVVVWVEDQGGQRSAELSAPVAAQPIKAMNELCDPTLRANRCDTGLGCRGEPATCHEGVAPEISHLAYLRTSQGPRILVEGADEDNDLRQLHLEFLDANGAPVLVDLDNDLMPDSSSFDLDVPDGGEGGTFFVSVLPSEDFVLAVAQLAVTPIDRSARQGARQTAMLVDALVRARGQGCDPHGFDECGSDLACMPGMVGANNTCQDLAASRLAQCRAAPRLDPGGAVRSVQGQAEGESLWDAPAGCSANDPTRRPEGIAVLRLRTRTPEVQITTVGPGTSFDTTVYVIPGCTGVPMPAIACADDGPMTTASTITLSDVPAGEYLLVVDSFAPEGGAYELSVSIP